MTDEVRALRKALLMCAASCQGGHSDAGQAVCNIFGIPFPVRMRNLARVAIEHGFDPAELWPWWKQLNPDSFAAATIGQGGT